ncbi:RecQ mediated genome instability protein N-terminal [Trinorchestia longiramus]|nr:RecQ mediated genome instability protein N-terminal [Trinorchestia longiramus]
MIDLITGVRNFFSTKKIKLPHEWIEACVHWLQEEHSNEPQNVLNATWVCQKAYEQWLFADLSELSHGFLPDYLHERVSTLQEDMVLQINSIQDVGMPSYAQLQQLRKDDIQNNQIDTDKVKPQLWEPKPHRMLLITLTDGVSTVLGMEYTVLSCLSLQTQPGTKMMVRRGCQARRGVLLLTSAMVVVLGGAVDTLLVTNAVENVVRRQLGLEEVENPAVYEEPAAAPAVSSSQASQYCPGTQSQSLSNQGNGGHKNQVGRGSSSQVGRGSGNQVGRGSGNQVGRGSGNQVGRGSGNQVGRGSGNQVGRVSGRLPTNATCPDNVQPATITDGTASSNLELELDDDFDLDLEAAMLEAEFAHSSAQGLAGSQNTRNIESSNSKLLKSANNVSCNSLKNTGSSNCGKSVSSNAWNTSRQTGSSTTFINLENRIPNISRPRPKLSYNPFLEPGPNNQPPATASALNKCEEDFDDGFSEQDLSAIEEELQFVESQVSQSSCDASKKIPVCESASKILPSTNADRPDPLASRDIPALRLDNQETSKNFSISVAPQKKTLFKSLESRSPSNKEDSTGIRQGSSTAQALVSSKLKNDDHRTSIKRLPDPLSNESNNSPVSNKLRKLNSINNLTLPSPNNSEPRMKDKLKKEISKTLDTDNGAVKNRSVVSPEENKSFQNKDRLGLKNAAEVQGKTSVSDAAKVGNPVTYLIFLPQFPRAEQEFVVKGFVMTLLSRLEQHQDEWKLTVNINDGSAGLDVDIHDQVLRRLIGISVPEMRQLKAKANLDPSIRATLTEVSSDVPEVSSDVPEVSSDVPEVSLDGPEVSSDVPEVSSDVPEVSSDGPEMSSDGPEMSSDGPEASLDVPEKVTRCREKLISLCSLLTLRVSHELPRPLLVNIAPFTQNHAQQLQQRCQLCLL